VEGQGAAFIITLPKQPAWAKPKYYM
jgi:hypothetical protein